MELRPCAGCRRHVASDASACPFCAAPVAIASRAVDPANRLSRAAVFAVGVASAALGAGCWTNKSEPQHVQKAEPQDAAVVTPDAAVVQTLPPPDPDPDNGNGHYQNHPCVM